MTDKIPTRKVVVAHVLEGLLQTVQRCFLIEVPPGCEQQPEVLQEIYQGFQRQLPRSALRMDYRRPVRRRNRCYKRAYLSMDSKRSRNGSSLGRGARISWR